MTKQEIKKEILSDLGQATNKLLEEGLQGINKEYYLAQMGMVEFNFLVDKLSDLQLQIQELRGLLNNGLPPKSE